MSEELKKAFESAKTEEQVKAVAEKFKDEIRKLSQEELDEVSGGAKKFDLSELEGGLRTH